MVPVKNTNTVMARSTADLEFLLIRPYRDEECQAVITKLLKKDQLFSNLARFRFPTLSRLMPNFAMRLCRAIIRYKLHQVKDIRSFQVHITGWFFFRMLDKTSSGINIQLESPFENRGHLLFSNHRDISLDPAVICYSLYRENQPICMIGIGDNLLTNEYASDIMRLNRSFIVKRARKDSNRREIYIEMRRLSSFIHIAISEKENIWLAQREGRAKDSRDKTSQAVLKMLNLNAVKGESPAATLNRLNLRPVSISYEYDPCAIHKARAVSEGIQKSSSPEHSDLNELVEGITGFKGRINVFIGKRFHWDENKDLTKITTEIDQAIINNYRLYPSHFYALRLLVEKGKEAQERLDAAIKAFVPSQPLVCRYLQKRLDKVPSKWLEAYLRIYANPVLEKLSAQGL